VVAINRGKTRADELLSHKFELDCASALEAILPGLDSVTDSSAEKCDPLPA
jgi:hypothetical protein